MSTDFKAMREQLRIGKAVQVVSAPQLFPTPPDVARRMVELLDLDNWNGEAWETMRVLEPSAGTGNLVAAVLEAHDDCDVYAWEINHALADGLRAKALPQLRVITGDFLEKPPAQTPPEQFDAVIMNPPFERGSWEKHLRHAWRDVRPGGRLCAVLPQAPRWRDVCRELGSAGYHYETLPGNTFAGTGVNTVLVLLEKDETP